MNENSSISCLKGIGEKTEKLFHRIGVKTTGDLIRYYPRSYEIYEAPVPAGQTEEGRVCTVCGTVFGRIQVSGNQRLPVTTLFLKDLTGTIKVIWFRMPFLRNTLAKGGLLILRGRVVRRREGLVMEHPEIFYPASSYQEKQDTMQPVYALTAGLTNHAVMKAVRQALETVDIRDSVLPERYEARYGFPPFPAALKNMHFPETKENYIQARRRFVFEEFFLFVLSLRKLREKGKRAANAFSFPEEGWIRRFLEELPYELTGAQQKVWEEIKKDMQGEHVMSRLIQGDVGSGKTILAFLALFLAGINGYQGAMMAPTEVLARQHYETICRMLERHRIPLKAELLTGSMTAAQKKKACERIADGEADLIIGTHALIQEKVIYRNLALVVTDEQHRFGVRQRETLAEKGEAPHILVMSATPIPRTLAIILYGDLDISVIDEMPKNRLPIKNCVVDTGYRHKAYSFMKKQIQAGRQCYIICPMVEESENLEAENVMDYYDMLSEVMGPGIRTGYLHGRMKQQEKDQIMEAFGENQIQVLVSTTVVEVGIDVPNASVIMIENAERFGLAQLHQLRGRVGRGQYQSYCIFMTSSRAKETRERLEILNHSNDGFYIAGEDLKLRGPGDLFGIRQSGMMDFRLGDIYQDAELLRQAAADAEALLREDPLLGAPENRRVCAALERYLSDRSLEATL